MAQTMKLKRGLSANLASLTLVAGEPAFTTDTGKLYVGDGTNNILINPDISETADSLTNARDIALNGDVSGSVSFDGSSDVTITTTVADNSHNHTSANISDATNVNTASMIVKRDASGNFSAGTITATLSGNSSTTTKLATARTISTSGDATGTATSFDGSANITIPMTLASVGTAGTYTKVTTDVKGRVTSGTTLSATDIPTITASKVSDFNTQVRTNTLNQMTLPTTDLNINNHKIINVTTPTVDTDVANKAYVDNARSGLTVKEPVRVATTTNLSTTYSLGILTASTFGSLVIDGVTLALNDRVLVKDQTLGTQNGIYYVTAIGGASAYWTLTRTLDANISSEVVGGMCVWVNEGTVNSDSRYVLTTNDNITLDTTSLTFTKDFQAGDIVAGTGITKNGSTISLGTSGVTNGTYKSVTVDTYGRVTYGTNPTTLSGYGITDGVNSSDVVTTATASKILKLDSSGYLPTSITGNSATATKLATSRTFTLSGDVTGSVSFDGSANPTITTTVVDDSHNHVISNVDNLQTTLDAKTPFSSKSATTPTTTQWYRIATSSVNIGANSGLFKVDFSGTGVKGSALFRASCHDGVAVGTAINQLGFTTTANTKGLTQVRVVYHTTYTANYAYVEIYNPTALAITYTVDLIDTTGWSLLTPTTVGSIPSGYTSETLTFDTGFVSAEDVIATRQLKSNMATGTAPLVVTSTTVNANLNADMLDGQHGSYYAPLASPTFTGIPLSTTATAGTNTTQVATTAFVTTAVANKTTITGNAGTATKLATARTINGVAFDGTANITITAEALAIDGGTF